MDAMFRKLGSLATPCAEFAHVCPLTHVCLASSRRTTCGGLIFLKLLCYAINQPEPYIRVIYIVCKLCLVFVLCVVVKVNYVYFHHFLHRLAAKLGIVRVANTSVFLFFCLIYFIYWFSSNRIQR